MLKQQYGGTIKVAEEFLQAQQSQPLFEIRADQATPLFPLPYQLKDQSLTLDLSSLSSGRKDEIRRSVENLQEYSSPCHWMLDYPHLNHEHQTSIRFEQEKLQIETMSPEILTTLITSSCLVPVNVPEFHAFRKTQFGFEANTDCISGRPFLDSLIPSPIDPTNPYLSFKLGDVDVVPVPEERFHEMNKDPELKLYPGTKHFLYLKSSGLTQQEVAYILQNINVEELVRTVLNDHAEAMLTRSPASSTTKIPLTISFPIPIEDPYGLLVQRMIVQLQDAGITVDSQTKQNRSIELVVSQVTESDSDISRYLLLREDLKTSTPGEWFDVWDELEASGKIVPLMIHQSRIAARRQIQDLRVMKNGMTEFSNSWLFAEENESR